MPPPPPPPAAPGHIFLSLGLQQANCQWAEKQQLNRWRNDLVVGEFEELAGIFCECNHANFSSFSSGDPRLLNDSRFCLAICLGCRMPAACIAPCHIVLRSDFRLCQHNMRVDNGRLGNSAVHHHGRHSRRLHHHCQRFNLQT